MENKKRINNISAIIMTIIVLLLLNVFSLSTCAQKTYTLKLAHYSMIGGMEDRCANKFKEIVEEKSGGQLKVEVYPGGQLGEETECAQGVLMGTIPMTIVCPPDYRDVVDGFGIDNLPFLFNSVDEALRLLNSGIGKELEKALIEKGARILGWHVYGDRHLIFANKDVRSFDNLKGLKMRSPEVDIFIEMFKSLGTQPTPITWGEAYLALQTGLADGMDTPIVDIKIMHFYEVAKYCLLTSHMIGSQILLINENIYQSLPLELQEIVLYAGKEAVDFINHVAISEISEIKTWLEKEGGVKFNEITEEDRQKFKEALLPLQQSWAEDNNSIDLLNKIIEFQK